MDSSKPVWKSLTFWGLVLSGAVQAAEQGGAIPSGTASTVASFIGLVAALLGRFRAGGPLTVR